MLHCLQFRIALNKKAGLHLFLLAARPSLDLKTLGFPSPSHKEFGFLRFSLWSMVRHFLLFVNGVAHSKQSILRILWISVFFRSHQTLPSCSAPPEGRVILARLQSTQCLIFMPGIGMKQSICRCFATWILRLPHQTVPDEGLSPEGLVSYPYLQMPQVFGMHEV